MWKIAVFQVIALIIVAFIYAECSNSEDVLDWSFFPDVHEHLIKK